MGDGVEFQEALQNRHQDGILRLELRLEASQPVFIQTSGFGSCAIRLEIDRRFPVGERVPTFLNTVARANSSRSTTALSTGPY